MIYLAWIGYFFKSATMFGNTHGKVTAEIEGSIFGANDIAKIIRSVIPLLLPMGYVGKIVSSAEMIKK